MDYEGIAYRLSRLCIRSVQLLNYDDCLVVIKCGRINLDFIHDRFAAVSLFLLCALADKPGL